MASEKARIEAELVGTSQVLSDAARIDSALGKVGGTVARGIGGGLRAVGSALGSVVSDGLRAAGVLQSINFANAVEDAKRLDLTTAKLGQSAGVAGTVLKQNLDAAEAKTLSSSLAMADFARTIGRVTYDSKFAVDSVSALGDEALAAGRDLSEEIGIATTLHDIGVQAQGVGAELGRISDIAKNLGTTGGPQALKDSITALGPLLQGVATDTDQARARVEALVGVLGKKLKPQQATQVSAQALSFIRSHAAEIEYSTGRQVFDEKGQINDPTAILAAVKAYVDRKFGSNAAGKRRALQLQAGPELAAAILRTNFGEVDQVAAEAQDTGATTAAAETFRQSKEGKRIESQLAKDRGLRSAGEQALGIHDALVDKLGTTGAIATELVGGNLALKAAPAAGRAALGGLGAVGYGTAATVGAVTASFAAPAVAVLADVGRDRDTIGREYRVSHADVIGSEIGQAAIRAGDLTPVIGRAHNDPEVIAAAIATINANFAQLNETLKGQAAAYAQALKSGPALRVQTPAAPPPVNQ